MTVTPDVKKADKEKNLVQYLFKHVSVNVSTGKDDTGSDTFTTQTGRVSAASSAGIVLQARGKTFIIESHNIIDIEEMDRRKRLIRRYVRTIPSGRSAKQHLGDRHGILVSVLNSVDEETAYMMHENINHNDLGHQHGERVNSTFVDPGEANRAIEELNSEFDDESDSSQEE